MKVHTHLDAAKELAEAADWYGWKSEDLKAEFLADVRRATKLIGATPQSFSRLTDSTHRYIMKRFPYGIVYEIVGKQVRVLAFAHFKRRQNYWRSRQKSS